MVIISPSNIGNMDAWGGVMCVESPPFPITTHSHINEISTFIMGVIVAWTWCWYWGGSLAKIKHKRPFFVRGRGPEMINAYLLFSSTNPPLRLKSSWIPTTPSQIFILRVDLVQTTTYPIIFHNNKNFNTTITTNTAISNHNTRTTTHTISLQINTING